jgi:hypothetical protein
MQIELGGIRERNIIFYVFLPHFVPTNESNHHKILEKFDSDILRKVSKVKIFKSVKFKYVKIPDYYSCRDLLQRAIIRPNRITLSKVMLDFVGTSIPRKAKKISVTDPFLLWNPLVSKK